MYAGAEQVVDKYEKKCLDQSPDECYDLGQAAAQREYTFIFTTCLLSMCIPLLMFDFMSV